jgi:hypothetical protein
MTLLAFDVAIYGTLFLIITVSLYMLYLIQRGELKNENQN